MKTLVIYDSAYGNTAKVAKEITNTVRPFGSTKLVLADKFRTKDADDVDVIFIGTPTQGGKPTAAIQRVMQNLDADRMSRNRVHIAPFDTRYAIDAHGTFLKLLMKTIGFAAPKMAHNLRNKHVGIVENAEGFIVTNEKGPLAQDEILRASLWAKRVVSNAKAD